MPYFDNRPFNVVEDTGKNKLVYPTLGMQSAQEIAYDVMADLENVGYEVRFDFIIGYDNPKAGVSSQPISNRNYRDIESIERIENGTIRTSANPHQPNR